MKTKDAQLNEVDADTVKPEVDTDVKDEEKKEEEVPAEVVPTKEEPKAPTEVEAVKLEKDEEGTNEPTNGQKPPEADEKGDEKAPADSPEAPKGEEGKAESKPEAAEGEKSFVVSALVAKSLPELVQSGVLVAAKGAGEGVDLPKEIVGVLRKLCDEVVLQAKRADDLQVKLDAIPQKSVLPVVGQYEEAPSAKATSQKTVSQGFMDLLKKAS